MRTRTIKVVEVPAAEVGSEKGWTAPDGWRIVDSERFFVPGIGGVYRITLAAV